MKRFWKWLRGHLWIRRVHKRDPYVPQHDVTVVVAGNYRQFTQWCFARSLHPSSREVLYVPVNDYRCLLGRNGGIKEVVYTGTWRERPDISRLALELDLVMHKERAIWNYRVINREDQY